MLALVSKARFVIIRIMSHDKSCCATFNTESRPKLQQTSDQESFQ